MIITVEGKRYEAYPSNSTLSDVIEEYCGDYVCPTCKRWGERTCKLVMNDSHSGCSNYKEKR